MLEQLQFAQYLLKVKIFRGRSVQREQLRLATALRRCAPSLWEMMPEAATPEDHCSICRSKIVGLATVATKDLHSFAVASFASSTEVTN